MNDKTYLLSGIKTASSTRGCSQNYGPLLVTNYITAPDILGYHNWDPNFGNYPFNDLCVLPQNLCNSSALATGLRFLCRVWRDGGKGCVNYQLVGQVYACSLWG